MERRLISHTEAEFSCYFLPGYFPTLAAAAAAVLFPEANLVCVRKAETLGHPRNSLALASDATTCLAAKNP